MDIIRRLFHKSKTKEGKTNNKKENNWVHIISEKNQWEESKTETYLKRMQDEFSIFPKELRNKDLNEMSETTVVVSVLLDRRKKTRKENYYSLISDATGMERKDIQTHFRRLRKLLPEEKITFQPYFRYGGYNLDLQDEESCAFWVGKINELKEKNQSIYDLLEKDGFTSYAESEIEGFRDQIAELLSEAKEKHLYNFIKDVRKDIKPGTDDYHELMVDMELTDKLLDFRGDEYAIFHFWDIPMKQRREFISDKLRGDIFRQLNTTQGMDILNNKYETYKRLHDLYGREMVLMDSESGFNTLKEFAEKNDDFVKKSNFDSLGRGIERVRITEDVNLEELYRELTNDCKYIILEELIKPHEFVKKLNPSSVNTLRVTTLFTDKGPIVQDSFLKIGRDGSFVDNGGRGGIFVHVDKDSGRTDSTGIVETGIVYTEHPDHGYQLKGIQMPEWSEALRLVKLAAERIPEIRYAGWDITYVNDNRWIIVEGNAKTQFFGQQATLGKGLRERFIEDVKPYCG